MSTTLLDKSRLSLVLGDYAVAQATALTDPALLPKVQEYRRAAGSRMQPLDRDGIAHKIPDAEFHVSRKIDGEFTVLVFRDNQALLVNPGGTVRVGLPVLDEAAKALAKAGVRDALIAAELFVAKDAKARSRVHDVVSTARKPQSVADLERLHLAVFDVIAKDSAPVSQPFAETWKLLGKWFGAGTRVRPVESKTAKGTGEVERLFDEWVARDGDEGIVARSDSAGTFKVKTRHTLDLAVLGFTESLAERQGMLHDLLLGVKRFDNTLHVLGRVGGGFTEDQRREMLSDLKDMAVDSEYAEVNGDNVAYQMVEPEWVVEISCLDLLSETTRGGPIQRMVLDYGENGSRGYHVVAKLPLATIISPQFVRRRDDKRVRPEDCGLRQIAGVVTVQDTERDARKLTLPCSEILRREVFTKDLKGQTMVRKFLLWKTNKETASDEFPAYVLHFTDFSPNRKDALAREVRVSSSREQIDALWDAFKAENVKGGWNRADAPLGEAAPSATAPATATETLAAPAPPKKSRKKSEPAEVAPTEPAEVSPSEVEKKPASRRKKKSE